MSKPDDLFVGWAAKAPLQDRRFMLLAALGLVAGGGAAAAGLARRGPGPSVAGWDQADVRPYAGVLVQTPYPTLLTLSPQGGVRSMLLVGYDKTALPPLDALPAWIEIEASALQRGQEAMLAIADRDGWSRLQREPPPFTLPMEEDLGPAMRLGEIVDAKCWFGAMNPGYGLTHKACAALCARGGLPLAFCPIGECATADEVCLMLDDAGRPHGAAIIPFLADPVMARGRLHRRNGILEFRVSGEDLRRV